MDGKSGRHPSMALHIWVNMLGLFKIGCETAGRTILGVFTQQNVHSQVYPASQNDVLHKNT